MANQDLLFPILIRAPSILNPEAFKATAISAIKASVKLTKTQQDGGKGQGYDQARRAAHSRQSSAPQIESDKQAASCSGHIDLRV